MMGVMATQNQSLDGDTIELLMVDYIDEATRKKKVDNADIEHVSLLTKTTSTKDGSMHQLLLLWGHVDHE